MATSPASTAAKLPVQEGGRVKPLSTFAGFRLLRMNAKRKVVTPWGEKLGPTVITPQIVLQRLIDVRSPEFFEVEYLVTLSWYDRRIFSECNGTVKSTEAKDPGRKVDSCDIYWRPELQLPNALDGEVCEAARRSPLYPTSTPSTLQPRIHHQG